MQLRADRCAVFSSHLRLKCPSWTFKQMNIQWKWATARKCGYIYFESFIYLAQFKKSLYWVMWDHLLLSEVREHVICWSFYCTFTKVACIACSMTAGTLIFLIFWLVVFGSSRHWLTWHPWGTCIKAPTDCENSVCCSHTVWYGSNKLGVWYQLSCL